MDLKLCLFVLHTGDTVLYYNSPVMANEEVFPVSGSDGHYLVRVAFKHLLYSLHFFTATYANFYIGISVRYRHKVLNRCKYKIRKNTD